MVEPHPLAVEDTAEDEDVSQDVHYGPFAFRADLPEFRWAVKKAYREPTGATVWRGVVTLFFRGAPMVDIEVQVIRGDKGEFVAWPQRPYKTKWMTIVWWRDRRHNAVALEAIRLWREVQRVTKAAETRAAKSQEQKEVGL